MLKNVTPLILTYNEAPNIQRALQHLTWAQNIVVVDSYSNDATLEILNSYPQIKLFQRKFDTHATQWNYGLQQVNSEWVLSLDADYIVSDELIYEIKDLIPQSQIDGYFARFKYCIFSKPLRSNILPPRQILFRKSQAIYIDDGHTQLLQIKGKSSMLSSYIYHDDHKPLSHWLWAQDRYMIIEAKKILTTPESELNFSDRIRKHKILAPLIILVYCLIVKGGVLDGWRGWYYTFQRVMAEILLSIRLFEYEKMQNIDA
ncbi:MAG: glycosyltransferase family 2 protein [Goleter apudmare HA4340-LM2]|jgi:glycosyltransferase involved in cell wall biosynthesis|nr:glycosyltransferase family 2 protein [Goleter apudmare HA4340-LM2]